MKEINDVLIEKEIIKTMHPAKSQRGDIRKYFFCRATTILKVTRTYPLGKCWKQWSGHLKRKIPTNEDEKSSDIRYEKMNSKSSVGRNKNTEQKYRDRWTEIE